MQAKVGWPGRVTPSFSLYKAFSQGASASSISTRSPQDTVGPHMGNSKLALSMSQSTGPRVLKGQKLWARQICFPSFPFRDCLLHFTQPYTLALLGFQDSWPPLATVSHGMLLLLRQEPSN